MGAHELDETSPLLPAQGAAVQEPAVAVAVGHDAPKAWRGALLNCFAGCDQNSWGSCLLSYFLPCIAFGQNMKRALSLSAVSQAALYVMLFLSGRALYSWSSRGVALACPAPFPEHHHGHGHHGHHGHHDFTEGHGFQAGLDQLQTTPLPGSHNASHPAGHQHGPPPPMTPECHQAMAILGTAYCVFVLMAAVGVLYAAHRRTQIREKFGIAGSRIGDFCTWCWCAPCALCQETRTIWHNNVHGGVWHGQTQLLITEPSYAAPIVNEMKADYKPVLAKEFV